MEEQNIRYSLDFDLIPLLFRLDPLSFAQECLAEKAAYFSTLFENQYYQNGSDLCFSPGEFPVQEKAYPNGVQIFYAAMPEKAADPQRFCRVHALTYRKTGMGLRDVDYFAVEADGTLISLDEDDTRVILGMAKGTNEEIMEQIVALASKKNGLPMDPEEQFETAVSRHSDGSWSRMIRSTRTGRGELHEYDAEGNAVHRVYFVTDEEEEPVKPSLPPERQRLQEVLEELNSAWTSLTNGQDTAKVLQRRMSERLDAEAPHWELRLFRFQQDSEGMKQHLRRLHETLVQIHGMPVPQQVCWAENQDMRMASAEELAFDCEIIRIRLGEVEKKITALLPDISPKWNRQSWVQLQAVLEWLHVWLEDLRQTESYWERLHLETD